jgi:hypothetical protein
MYPDGGVPTEDLVRVYETELEALNNSSEEKGWFEE